MSDPSLSERSPLSAAINEFWLAWTFLTRLPALGALDYSPDALNRAARFFPWVGFVLGLLQALAYSLALSLFDNVWLASMTSVMLGVLLTGAFHEDGFADYCDSFGGQDVSSRLRIMTDSRLGTFGVAGLFFILGFRVLLIATLPGTVVIAAIILSATLSRWLAISLMLNTPYAKSEGKSKPLANAINPRALLIGALPLLPLFIFVNITVLICVCVTLALFRVGFSAQLRQRLGGFTGDALGAAQQIAEVLVYSCMVALAV
ncbi:adenosylcobinamide-GDP ribazoletransferase [Litorivivens lipolytica]|uniref:adenosylcobinamide-GDP ribazoletransferase n=1 Tax=Litorivivens lipolytica TaxID=1524264 RepID=UPI001611E169|nr:adenosylcobinamide-GDP ribazoletransferase [Litorivivens lipolytica]